MTNLTGRSGTAGLPRELELTVSGAEVRLRFRNPRGRWQSAISVAISELQGALDGLPAESRVTGHSGERSRTLVVSPRDSSHEAVPEVWPPCVYLRRDDPIGWDVVVSAAELREALE